MNPEYDPEATVEFEPIFITDNEQELIHSINPDQLILEGFKEAMGDGKPETS